LQSALEALSVVSISRCAKTIRDGYEVVARERIVVAVVERISRVHRNENAFSNKNVAYIWRTFFLPYTY
jgi:hypothetical protein